MLNGNSVYELMHKDKKIGLINLDVTGTVVNYVPINNEFGPFLGNVKQKLQTEAGYCTL